MKFESILQIIFLGSSVGLGVIVFSKIPFLKTLPEKSSGSFEEKQDFLLRLKKEVKKLNPFKALTYEVFLEKILTDVRSVFLNMESKTSGLIKELKQNVEQSKAREKDNYWEKVKKSTRSRINSKSKNTDNLL